MLLSGLVGVVGCTATTLTPAASRLRVVERSETSEAEENRVRNSCTKLGHQEKGDDRTALLNAAAVRGADTVLLERPKKGGTFGTPSFGADYVAMSFRCEGPR